jgi:antitoxin component of MazEF toxin-antitoxin module
MSKKKPRLLDVGPEFEVKLPADVVEALGLESGEKVQIYIDARRKAVRLERHVDDPWTEALKDKDTPGFEDLMQDHDARQEDAKKLFEQKLKEKPEKPRPEDNPDLWR